MRADRATGFLAVVALLALIGCSPVTVSTDTSPTADFSKLHTFAWEPNPQDGGSVEDSIAGQNIHAAVEQALEAHGFRPAAGQPPDFLVEYRVKTQRESQVFGGRWNVQQYNYTLGTLMVALVDPGSKLDLWQGSAEGVVDPGGQTTPDIQQAVQKMFANFPS